jgi:hypothetical protein
MIPGMIQHSIVALNNKLVFDKRVREWCKLPYPGHAKGCPNIDKSWQCPNKIGFVYDIFDLLMPHWFVIVRFEIGSFAARMQYTHPEWSDKQCRCCLYWQNTVRKELRKVCERFVLSHEDLYYTLIPEAMGVHVFMTMNRLGYRMRRNPKDYLYKVALIGYDKKGKYRILPCRAGSREIFSSRPRIGHDLKEYFEVHEEGEV